MEHTTRRMRTSIAALAALTLLLGACSDDDSSSSADGGSGDAPAQDAGDGGATDDSGSSSDGGGSEDAPPAGAGGGTVTVGDETIALDSSRCYLQEQDSAGGGGKILMTAQGSGTNAAGDEVRVDFTRYDEESQFTGDDIVVDIGDYTSPDAVSYAARADLGTVAVDGSTLSADGLTFVDDDLVEVSGSFEITC